MNITYRPNRSNTLHAAYLGSVRVGYVEERHHDRFWWQTIFLRPEGNAYFGREEDEQSAKDALLKSVQHWTECAQLQQKEHQNETLSLDLPPAAPARRKPRKRSAANGR